MHIIFSHGKESGPEGGKIRRLCSVSEAMGCTTESIDYRDLMAEGNSPAANIADAQSRVVRLRNRLLSLNEPAVLVGSSMGGFVSWAAASDVITNGHDHIKGLFLMVPAVYMDGYPSLVEHVTLPPMSIVHGWQDDIVPFQNSLRLAEEQQADYHLLNDGHRLQKVLPQMATIFEGFLKKVLEQKC